MHSSIKTEGLAEDEQYRLRALILVNETGCSLRDALAAVALADEEQNHDHASDAQPRRH